jgi:DNA-binding transcriptional MerR regulator
LLPTRGDGLMRTNEVARMLGVDPSTVSKWRERGRITPDGLDERNRPLYRRATARAAERLVRENGLRTSGVDPRTIRKRAA